MALDHPHPFTSYDLSGSVVSSCWGCLTAFYVLNAATSQVEITQRCKETLALWNRFALLLLHMWEWRVPRLPLCLGTTEL